MLYGMMRYRYSLNGMDDDEVVDETSHDEEMDL
jgi:hypothetical protein